MSATADGTSSSLLELSTDATALQQAARKIEALSLARRSRRMRTSKTNSGMRALRRQRISVDTLPKSWDARVDHKRSAECKDLIEEPYDQGACGSCPSSLTGTLMGIESMVKRVDPEITVTAI